MAILKDGFYKIRFVPDGSKSPDADAMYATGRKMHDSVKVEKSSNNPQIWQIKQMDNTNYIIATDNTMEEEFRVAWSLANLTKSYSSQSSAPAPGTICLKNPGKTFALNPKKGEKEENAIYSIKVSDGSSDLINAFVTVDDQTVMAQESLIEDISYIWKFEFVRPK